jgi:sulfur-carrier protein
MQVRVLFFGALTEVAGTDCRVYGDARSSDDLIHRIMDDYPEIAHFNYRTAVNNELIDGNRELSDGDEVALMPPFAGG